MTDPCGPQGPDAPISLHLGVGGPAFADQRLNLESTIPEHRQSLLSSLDRIGAGELAARTENIRRILAEHGVSCVTAGDNGASDEPWSLDLVPLVIGAKEWRELESGVLQRARLLNLILADLYGTQRLVRDGLVPVPLVYANPSYLRACQAIAAKNDVYLQIYAVDLGRSADGSWKILADRTQAPTGLGFALENRSVLARVLPEVIRDMQPRPLLEALGVQRDIMRRFAPQRPDHPSIVLLTPGPANEAYFEHAYLSRLLGLTLVEGDDLTIRDRRLFSKTLEGLRRVDMVVRRVADAFCDPLELCGDSELGVPGLVEAVRAGHVAIGNALGTGLLESPAFMPFLPRLCRHLLDQELLLQSRATWWCGHASEHAHVINRLEDLVVRPAFSPEEPAVTLTELPADRPKLREELLRFPHEFVGQEQIQLSRAPFWNTNHHRESRPFVLRVFVLHNGTEFTVMPGGLARIVEQDNLWACPALLGGLSKDVWVLPESPTAHPQVTLESASLPTLERAPSDLPSSRADKLFWLGRYTERLEQAVRAALEILRCLADDSIAPSRRRLAPLEKVLRSLGLFSESAGNTGAREELQKEILQLLFQDERTGGVRDLLRRIHLVAFSVRDRLSADTWRILNRLEADALQRPGPLPIVQTSGVLHTLILDLAAFSGMEMENMTRGHGWGFLDMGRRIERGMFIARLLEVVWLSTADFDLLLEPVLEIADSVMTHRRRYFCEPSPTSTLEVLVQDFANPRSLAFQLARLKNHAATLPTGANPEGIDAVHHAVDQFDWHLRSLKESVSRNTPSEIANTADALAALRTGLADLSEVLTQLYFSHVRPQVS